MQDDSVPTVYIRDDTQTAVSLGRQTIRFVFHLASVYLVVLICSSALAGWTYRNLFSALQIHTKRSSFEFLYTHLLFFSFVPAFLTGLVNARFKHRVAEFVWIIPSLVLLYKLVTFPAMGSVGTNLFMAGSARIFRRRIPYCGISQLDSVRTIVLQSRYGQGNDSTNLYGAFLRRCCVFFGGYDRPSQSGASDSA